MARGPHPVRSLESDDGVHCVDLFKRPDGSFGFEEYRRDPEDRGLWTMVGEFSGRRFDSEAAALAAARDAVRWLSEATPN